MARVFVIFNDDSRGERRAALVDAAHARMCLVDDVAYRIPVSFAYTGVTVDWLLLVAYSVVNLALHQSDEERVNAGNCAAAFCASRDGDGRS